MSRPAAPTLPSPPLMLPTRQPPAHATPSQPSAQASPSPTASPSQLVKARTFRIPCFDLPAPRPRAAIDFSIVEQIDGLLYALFGARLERDVLAPSDAEAVCDLRGLRPWECLAVDIGWYHGCRQQIEEVVAVAASHRACGVFVVPAREHAAAVQRATMFDYRSRKRKRTVIAWWEFLAKATRFTFTLPPDAFTPPASCPMTAVLADFGRGGFLVAKQKCMDEIRRGFLYLAASTSPARATALVSCPCSTRAYRRLRTYSALRLPLTLPQLPRPSHLCLLMSAGASRRSPVDGRRTSSSTRQQSTPTSARVH